MTADQREQALAALDRIFDRTFGSAQFRIEDENAIRAALTPHLPADLAAIQARADAATRAAERYEEYGAREYWDLFVDALIASQRDLPALVAELAELRARPTLTAEDAREVQAHIPDDGLSCSPLEKLRAIAEGDGA